MLRTVRVLAENGPVRVELAHEDTPTSARLVVVKRLLGVHPTLERRLAREAEVAMKLDHPGVLPLLVERGGVLHYPYLPGPTLAEVLEQGPLPVARALHHASLLLDALAYAHDLGIVHNDVKPANLVVRGDEIVLLDFGFAKDTGLAAITGPGVAMGTPNYMAPEQFEGGRSDPRSDLYGVAAVVYHAVTGAPPYGRHVLRVLAGQRDIPLAAPRPLEGSLERWLLRALELDPRSRFPDAPTMRAALLDARALWRAEMRASSP